MSELPRVVTTEEYAKALDELLTALDRMEGGRALFSLNVEMARADARALIPAKPTRVAKKDRSA